MEFFPLIIFLPILTVFVSSNRTYRNSEIHRRYLEEISSVNQKEINNHILDWEWRYDWLGKCYHSVSWWKFWQSIEKAYVDSEEVLRERVPEDMIPTYQIIPGFIKERDEITR